MEPQTNTPQPTPGGASANHSQPILTPSPRKTKTITVVAIILALAALITAAIVFMQNSALDKESEETAPVAQIIIASSGEFNPSTIKVKRGQTVTWTNNDSAAHSIAATEDPANDALEGFGSEGQINLGETYSYTFDQTGTFVYNDPNNPFESAGTVVVEE